MPHDGFDSARQRIKGLFAGALSRRYDSRNTPLSVRWFGGYA